MSRKQTTQPESESEGRTWTFQPTDEVKSLVKKALNKQFGRGVNNRLRSRLINEALRQRFAELLGKREEV